MVLAEMVGSLNGGLAAAKENTRRKPRIWQANPPKDVPVDKEGWPPTGF